MPRHRRHSGFPEGRSQLPWGTRIYVLRPQVPVWIGYSAGQRKSSPRRKAEAPGNGAPIGGLKAVTASGWFAAARAGIGPRGRLRAGAALVARGEFSIVIAAAVAILPYAAIRAGAPWKADR